MHHSLAVHPGFASLRPIVDSVLVGRREYRVFIKAMLLALAAIAIAPELSVSAQVDRNCDDFEDHAAAVHWFDQKGGSTGFDAGGLDGDRDGIPCEGLVRSGPVAFLDDVSGGHPVIGGATLTILVLLVVVGLVIRIRRRASRPSHLEQFASPSPSPTTEPAFVPRVPPLKQVESTGVLVLSIAMEHGGPLPPALEVDLNGATTVVTLRSNSVIHEHTADLPVGEYTVRVTGGHGWAGTAVVTISKDDVTRQTIHLKLGNASFPNQT